MGTTPETAAFFLEQLAGRGITLRRMFGEYAVQRAGKTLGLLCDDALFVRQLPEVAAHLGTPVEGLPYPGAKPWWRIEPDQWEEADWLAGLLARIDAALPAPKPKAPKTPKPKTPKAAQPAKPRQAH